MPKPLPGEPFMGCSMSVKLQDEDSETLRLLHTGTADSAEARSGFAEAFQGYAIFPEMEWP